ncbi:MAG: hypothetical protein ACXVHX_29385 [Solirubrobacteraceae bacterium]
MGKRDGAGVQVDLAPHESEHFPEPRASFSRELEDQPVILVHRFEEPTQLRSRQHSFRSLIVA